MKDKLLTICYSAGVSSFFLIKVAKARKNEVWRTQYIKEWVVLQDAKDEGREEEIRSRVEIMLRKGKTVEEIVDFCEYPHDLVKSIEEELQSV